MLYFWPSCLPFNPNSYVTQQTIIHSLFTVYLIQAVPMQFIYYCINNAVILLGYVLYNALLCRLKSIISAHILIIKCSSAKWHVHSSNRNPPCCGGLKLGSTDPPGHDSAPAGAISSLAQIILQLFYALSYINK